MHTRPRRRSLLAAAFVALAMFGSALVLPSPAQAESATVTCHDGDTGTGGVTGYLSGSGCAKKIAHYTYNECSVSHSDEPGGPQDTLSVSCVGFVPPPLGNSRPPTGQLIECKMRATGAECTGWAEDPDSPNTPLIVDFNVAASSVYPAHRQSTGNSSYGITSIKAGKRWFWKVPVWDVFNGTNIEVVVRGVNSSGVRDGVNTTLGVRKIGPKSVGGNLGKYASTVTGGTKATGKVTLGTRYNCTSTIPAKRSLPQIEWNNPLAGTQMYTKQERWCQEFLLDGVRFGRIVTEFNVRFEGALWNVPLTRRFLVNSNNVVYWQGNHSAVPRPDNIDVAMTLYVTGVALTLEAGPAGLELENGTLTGECGTATENESEVGCSTSGTVITYAGVAAPVLELSASGRFGTDYFQTTSSVAGFLT